MARKRKFKGLNSEKSIVQECVPENVSEVTKTRSARSGSKNALKKSGTAEVDTESKSKRRIARRGNKAKVLTEETEGSLVESVKRGRATKRALKELKNAKNFSYSQAVERQGGFSEESTDDLLVKKKLRQTKKQCEKPKTCISKVKIAGSEKNGFQNFKYGKEFAEDNSKSGCSKGYGQTASYSSGSEDEWLDVEDAEEFHSSMKEDIEVTLKVAPQQETEESKAAKFLRLEINRKIRERQVRCHEMHLLCYVTHLRSWARALVRSEVLKSLCYSLIPDGYVTAAMHGFDIPLAQRFLKWLTSAMTFTSTSYSATDGFCSAQATRLENLIGDKVYETDKDLASITFLFFLALKQSVRLVLSCQLISLKVSIDDLLSQKKVEDLVGIKDQKCDKSHIEIGSRSNLNSDSKEGCRRRKKVCGKSKDSEKLRSRVSDISGDRNYWIEYWDENADRWICVDPLMKTVDLPTAIEEKATTPMHYVLAVDETLGIRDVTARYASRYLFHDVRRLRTDPVWWDSTLKLFQSKNRARRRLEDVQLHDYLMLQPLPTKISDFKNHPLYVVKKDLLKFEAIYPLDQPPVGKIHGLDIYPRSCVYHLDGSLNWIKKARSIKPGEKPYKVVRARPDIRIPKEQRQTEKTLDLYGFWQTEPYVPPKVINGRIPRNEHGNLYLYKRSMLPEGCAYLRLDGIYGVARRLNLECVPCVVGWEFHKNGNHPIIDGCAVLKEDEEKLQNAWSKEYTKKLVRANQKRKERARKNWRRLYRGVILMKKVRAKFAGNDQRNINIDEQFGDQDVGVGSVTEDPALFSWPATEFNLPLTEDVNNKKS